MEKNTCGLKRKRNDRVTEAETIAAKSWISGRQNRNVETLLCISGFEGHAEKQSNEKLPDKGD